MKHKPHNPPSLLPSPLLPTRTYYFQSNQRTLTFSIQFSSLQVGFGSDQHGQDATKAAIKACRSAIEFNSIPSINQIVPGGYDVMKVVCVMASLPFLLLYSRTRYLLRARARCNAILNPSFHPLSLLPPWLPPCSLPSSSRASAHRPSQGRPLKPISEINYYLLAIMQVSLSSTNQLTAPSLPPSLPPSRPPPPGPRPTRRPRRGLRN